MMKSIVVVSLLVLSLSATYAQSKSFQTLRDHFSESEEVHSFSFSGFLCRAAVNMMMDEDDELMKDLMSDIDHMRFMVIPKAEFDKQKLTVSGFRKYLLKDDFEEMLSVRDHGDHINVFMREDGNNKNRYFVLVEEADEVVAIEMKGYIDPELFKNENNRISFTLD